MAKLGDFVRIKHGFAFKGDYITAEDNEIVLVTPGNFEIGGGFKEKKCKFFSGDYPKDYVLHADDLIVTMTDLSKQGDTLGYSARVPNSNRIYLHNQRIGLVDVFNPNADKDYLYWFMRTPQYQKKIVATASGSTVKHTSPSRICDVEINLPSIDKQKKIASLLTSIEKKIHISERINDNLLRQAQALYKNRFIDLKPFNGEMPPDWQLGTVSEIIELHDSKRIPLSSRERANLTKIYPYYGATSVMDYVDRYLFDGIYLLLGEDGTVVDDKGFPILQYVEGKFWVNNHAHIITGKNGFTVETLYLLFSLTNVRSIVTGAVQPKISQANLNNVSVVIPSKAELSTFNSIVQPIFSQIRNLRAESDRLTSTRDILLPRLMSGEIDVSAVHL